jgi:hypothetical protein
MTGTYFVGLLQWSFSWIESVKCKRHSSVAVVACLCQAETDSALPTLTRPPTLFRMSGRGGDSLNSAIPVCQRYGTISITGRASWFCSSLGFWVSQAGIRQCLPSCGRFNFHWREAKQATCSQHPARRRPIWLLSHTMKVRLLFSVSRIGGDKERVRHKNVFLLFPFFLVTFCGKWWIKGEKEGEQGL